MQKLQENSAPLNKILWDCDSSLYDSFELKSFERQLDAAIVSRTLSMPHLSFDRTLAQPPKKQKSKLARRLYKLIPSIFCRKMPDYLQPESWQMEHRVYCSSVYTLTTIPEVCKKGLESPELDPVVRKTVLERFGANTAGGLLEMPVAS